MLSRLYLHRVMNPSEKVENLSIHPAKLFGKTGTVGQNMWRVNARFPVLHKFLSLHLIPLPLLHGQNVHRYLPHSNDRHYDYFDYISPSARVNLRPIPGRME